MRNHREAVTHPFVGPVLPWSIVLLTMLAIAGIPAASAQQASAQAVTHAAPAPPWPDTAWRQIGPASFGGRVDDIEAVDDDPRIIFVGSASGGVFRSRDNGVTWDPVFDADGATLSIGDIAIAPSDPHIVWVGTGEANNRQTSTWGDGVYRSLDGGTTWRNMGLRETQSIGRVVIDPHDPNVVFVAAAGHLFGPNEQRGLYRTRDGGATWQKVLGIDANTGVIDVALAGDGHTLFAATYERRRRAFGFVGGGPGSGIWRSIDGGDTWTHLTTGLPAGNVGRIGLAIAKSDPRVIYAVIEHQRDGGVYRSTDGGTTWTKRSRANERGDYFSQIRVDPSNPDRVWLLLTSLYLSIDGGKTFSDDSVAVRVHPDNHALWIDPHRPDHMMLGNDGGVWFTYDGARHWDYVNNIPIGQFYDVAIDDRDPYWIYGGLQDLGTFAFPSGTHSRGALTDDQVTFLEYGDGFQAAPDPTNPRLVYTNSQNGRGYLVDMVTREERRFTPVPPDSTERYRFNWNTAALVSPNDPHVYYYGANRLLETTDRGGTWTVLSPDLTRNEKDWKTRSLGDGLPPRDSAPSRDDGTGLYGNITTISESPRAAGTLYVGTDDGNVQMTTDHGAHWTDLTARFRLRAPRWVSAVLASRADARTAYVAFDGHRDDDLTPYIFKTTDGGATWTSIAGDLPIGMVIKTLAEDPRNPSLLFAGTEFGLYWSFDGGRHWRFPGGTLPRVMVDRILIGTGTGDLILGTYGRSMIILDDIRALEAGDPALDTRPVALFPLRDATEFYQWRDQPLAGTRQWLAPNAPVGALITYALHGPADSAGVHIRVTSAGGVVVRELTGPSTEGLHRVLWDLHAQYAFTPTAADSGFYGAPRAPYVPPGDYTITITARGHTVSQPVHVRTDPASLGTPDGLAARERMMAAIDTLSRAFRDGKKAYVALDSQLVHIRALAKAAPAPAPVDSVLRHVTERLAGLRRDFSEEYGAPIGNAFDLLGGLEGSSLPPTQAEDRTLAVVTAELRHTLAQLNDIITTDMPKLREAWVRQPLPAVQPVTLP